jgi:hypothetical protein
MTTQQPEALRLANILRGIDARSLFANEKLSAASAALENQHARITELESQLAQRFDAADMATASAQGFMDGVASVSAWSEHVEQRLLAWRQSFVNRSGDQLALDDFMDKQSIDDLIDFVCDESHRVTHWMPLPTAPGPADGESK